MSDPSFVSVVLHTGGRDGADFLTPEDIAAKLKTNVRHVHELLRTKQIPAAFKVGKLWRITERDFTAWLEAQKSAPRVTRQERPTRTVSVEIRRKERAG